MSGRRSGEIGSSPVPAALLLRPWAEDDAPALRAAIDEGVGHLRPWLGWSLEEPASLERTRERIAGWAEQHRRGTARRYAIVAEDRPSRILGGAWLKRRGVPAGPGPGSGDAASIELGYWVRRSAVRRGIATAAASALLVQAFDGEGVGRVVVRLDVANAASAAFARALGFDRAVEAEAAYPDGTPRPVVELGMEREDYARHATALRARAAGARIVAGV